jgi:hypothetical protein
MQTKQQHNRAPIPASDPAWEAAKAARRNLEHNEAVQESAYLEKQYRAMWRSNVAASPVDLNEILRTLIEKKVPFVLTGAHAIGGWTGRPRATHDVDILVKGGRNYARAVKVMRDLYPQLEERNFAGVTAFFVPGERESVIDVTYPHRADIAETLANPVWTEDKALGIRYRIPALESALANKYGAMLSPTRNPRKRQMDAIDFGWKVIHSTDEGRKPIDLQRLLELGEMVWPGGGGEEILRLVEMVKSDRQINLDLLGNNTAS